MRIRSLTLALGFCAVLALPALADTHVVVNAPPPPTVTFSTTPEWEMVPGTRVYVVNDQMRPDYDMFRVGSTYWIYDNGYWYRATSWNGDYVAVNSTAVPATISTVPQTYWRSYPTTWVSTHHSSRVITTRTSHHTNRSYRSTSAPGQVKHRHHRATGHAYGHSRSY